MLVGSWDRRPGGLAGCCPLSLLPTPCSTVCWSPVDTPTQQDLPACSDFPRKHPDPAAQRCWGVPVSSPLFPPSCLPPKEGRSSAPTLNTHLLLKKLFSQEELCHKFPVHTSTGLPCPLRHCFSCCWGNGSRPGMQLQSETLQGA